MSYEKYFKDVSGYDVIDVYRTHRIFGLTDEVLCHASKKLLLSGVRTGGKTLEQDVREARDSLNRWLEMLAEDLGNAQEKDGWTPEAINEAAFKDAYKEYTLQEVLGNATVPSWVRWVVVTKNGTVAICELEPVPHIDSGLWEFAGAFEIVNKVVPPISFKNCIWRVNK